MNKLNKKAYAVAVDVFDINGVHSCNIKGYRDTRLEAVAYAAELELAGHTDVKIIYVGLGPDPSKKAPQTAREKLLEGANEPEFSNDVERAWDAIGDIVDDRLREPSKGSSHEESINMDYTSEDDEEK